MSYKSPPVGNEISCVFHGIAEKLLSDTKGLEQELIAALNDDGFTILESISHEFKPCGYTITVLIAESHAVLHTYPEYNSLYFGIYSCRGENDGQKTYEQLKSYLKPESEECSNRKIVVVNPIKSKNAVGPRGF